MGARFLLHAIKASVEVELSKALSGDRGAGQRDAGDCFGEVASSCVTVAGCSWISVGGVHKLATGPELAA